MHNTSMKSAGRQNVIAGQDTHRTTRLVGALARLSFARQKHPELRRAEATARIELAAAIIAMDTAEERISAGERIHSVHEQAAVESAMRTYADALADLVRGEAT